MHQKTTGLLNAGDETNKMARVMGQFGRGELHSGSKHGPIVTSRTQAEAIGISEQKKLDAQKGRRRHNRRRSKHGH